MTICTTCNEDKEYGECRPYGVKFAMICFPCMMATPESQEEARKNFIIQLNSIDGVVLIGDEFGPVPLVKENN